MKLRLLTIVSLLMLAALAGLFFSGWGMNLQPAPGELQRYAYVSRKGLGLVQTYDGTNYGPVSPGFRFMGIESSRVSTLRWSGVTIVQVRRISIVWLGLLFLIAPTCYAIRWLKYRRPIDPTRCRRCGYDLRATPDRCPECGTVPVAESEKAT